ncbi:MAG: type II toxin-antitoxin system RelB/DinJ family antitoxin [Lentisphaeria bacterium]|jgi:DNA-damage-inducible protein J|nr:type II toxin-antitoxin system RelB/DinJ family antitoxin [Lentisphaeria bacterium]
MSGKTVNYSLRLDAELKHEAELLLAEFGLNLSSAINVFLRQTLREQAIPFTIAVKGKSATLAAMHEALRLENNEQAKSFNSIDELRQDLLS